jgi:peptide deformylase
MDTGMARAHAPERTHEVGTLTSNPGLADRIRIVRDPVLRTPTTTVTAFDDDLRQLVARMFAAMYAAEGVGLAAPQIGVGLRVFVMDCAGLKVVLVNPSLRDPSEQTVEDELEGCLSVPGRHYPTPRAVAVSVAGRDEYGHPVLLREEGLRARCFQHETDHLDGKLYLDRLAGGVRRQAVRELRQQPPEPRHPSS